MNTLPRALRLLLSPVLAACLLAVCLLSACNADDDSDADAGPVTFEVTVKDWTGWSREQPKPETTQVTLAEGDSFEVEVIGGPATFTVVDVDDDRVQLTSDQNFSVSTGDGGISLNDTFDDFEIDRTRPLEIATPTMDGGTHVTFTRL